ncbi:MAG: signal recognition particle-docking protein FtsY [Treponema sp.]|jgi:fused signal recognition particle receptor|nr:signal recognition particle-docking protein FtsY [Treponema sp.]
MKFAEKIKSFFSGKSTVSDELFEELCDLLVEGDFGASEAYRTVEILKERCKKESPDTVPIRLAELLEEELRSVPSAPQLPDNLAVVLLLGVNGVGKTTTAAKLAFRYHDKFGKKAVLAAADTFRAAAIDQLKIHGQKLGVRVVAHKQGGDPAAVVYDALEAAVSGGAGVVIVDTAGRMHTKSALVEELRKIDRVVEAKAGAARYLKYLALDATTGRNACAQAEIFHEAVALDGIILTKYDSTAKGGVVFSLAQSLRLPVAYLCTGEKYGDIEEFDPCRFAKEFTGIE